MDDSHRVLINTSSPAKLDADRKKLLSEGGERPKTLSGVGSRDEFLSGTGGGASAQHEEMK